MTFSQLTNLSTFYKITDGDCGGGSPRFSISLEGGKNIFVYIGPNPNFTGCTPNIWISTGEFIGSSATFDTSQAGGTFYDTYAGAVSLVGPTIVTGISLVTDGGWVGTQVILFDNVQINTDLYTFDPAPVTVTIAKYLNGVQATSALTGGASYPMVSSWNATNIGAGSGSYSLGPVGFNNPIAYQATTSSMTSGADYSTNEVTGVDGILPVGSACQDGRTRLVGYSDGESIAAAALLVPTTTTPSFTDITSDKYVIVWNELCVAPTTKDQCKNDGWKKFNSPSFKNQGDCVSYVQSNFRAIGNKTK